MCVGVAIVASASDQKVLGGCGDEPGAGSVSSLVTNCSVDPVMTRNPSYKQIIRICFGIMGQLHNEINVVLLKLFCLFCLDYCQCCSFNVG